ncbi:uncharacterized protein [Antedon mediterranea]|uniref:uncharacterized protein n=1 Tax=Antedon mediterranea TaxID=105859 RepID=UPI003AF4DCF7
MELAMDSDNPPPGYWRQQSAPPTYDQVQKDAPPSYQAIFGEIKEAKAGSSGIVEFLAKIVMILLKTFACTIMMGVILAIPVAMIVIGLTYKNDCPGEMYIPVYLIIGGTFTVLKIVIDLWVRLTTWRDQESSNTAKQGLFTHLVGCFLFAWFIVGNMWIYGGKVDTRDVYADNYCSGVVYYFAFWLNTAIYITMGLFCCCICCTAYIVGEEPGTNAV